MEIVNYEFEWLETNSLYLNKIIILHYTVFCLQCNSPTIPATTDCKDNTAPGNQSCKPRWKGAAKTDGALPTCFQSDSGL